MRALVVISCVLWLVAAADGAAQSLVEAISLDSTRGLLKRIEEAHKRGDVAAHDKLLETHRDLTYLRQRGVKFLPVDMQRQVRREQQRIRQLEGRAARWLRPPIPASPMSATPEDFAFAKFEPYLKKMQAAFEAGDLRAYERAWQQVRAFEENGQEVSRRLYTEREKEAAARLRSILTETYERAKAYQKFRKNGRVPSFIPNEDTSMGRLDALLASVKSRHEAGDTRAWLLLKRDVDAFRTAFQARLRNFPRTRAGREQRRTANREFLERMERSHHSLMTPPGEKAPAPYDVAADHRHAAAWLTKACDEYAAALRREREAQRGGSYEQWDAARKDVQALDRARRRLRQPAPSGAQTTADRQISSHVWQSAQTRFILRIKRLQALHGYWCKLHPKPAKNPLDEPAAFPSSPLLEHVRADVTALLNGDRQAHARHLKAILALPRSETDGDSNVRVDLRTNFLFLNWRSLLGRRDQRHVLASDWIAMLAKAEPRAAVDRMKRVESAFSECNRWWGKGTFFAREKKLFGHTHASKPTASVRAAADVFAYQRKEWNSVLAERRAKHPGFRWTDERRGRGGVPKDRETSAENMRALRSDAVFTMTMRWMMEDLFLALRELARNTSPASPPFAPSYDAAVRALAQSGELKAIKTRALKARQAFLTKYGQCEDLGALRSFDSTPFLRMLGLPPLDAPVAAR